MDFEKYKNKDEFPRALTCSPPKSPNPADFKTKADFVKAGDEFIAKTVEYFNAREEYDKNVKSWNAKNNRLEREFKHDLLEELGLTGNPKADLLYSIAWEYGHSTGFEEVFYYASDLADLIR